MTERACISHDLIGPDIPRPCVRRGIHYAACENPDTCRGCVPRTATHGYLCVVCWEKLSDALSRVAWLIAHLRSIDTNGTNAGEKVDRSQERSILVPDSWLAADGLMEALDANVIPSTADIDQSIRLAQDAVAMWGDSEERVNTLGGARLALTLTRRMQTALHRWPDSEAEYREIPLILCPTCKQRHLWRKAPLEFLDDIYVECATPTCDYRMDWETWLTTYADLFAALETAKTASEKRRKTA